MARDAPATIQAARLSTVAESAFILFIIGLSAARIFRRRRTVSARQNAVGNWNSGYSGLCCFHAVACFGCREMTSVISAATIHSAPAVKNAGRYVASAVRDKPAPNAAVAAPS